METNDRGELVCNLCETIKKNSKRDVIDLCTLVRFKKREIVVGNLKFEHLWAGGIYVENSPLVECLVLGKIDLAEWLCFHHCIEKCDLDIPPQEHDLGWNILFELCERGAIDAAEWAIKKFGLTQQDAFRALTLHTWEFGEPVMENIDDLDTEFFTLGQDDGAEVYRIEQELKRQGKPIPQYKGKFKWLVERFRLILRTSEELREKYITALNLSLFPDNH